MDASTFIVMRREIQDRLESLRTELSNPDGQPVVPMSFVKRLAMPLLGSWFRQGTRLIPSSLMKGLVVAGVGRLAASMIERTSLPRWIPWKLVSRLL